MQTCEQNTPPHAEALLLLELLKTGRGGLHTAADVLDLIRIPGPQRRFLEPHEIEYREQVEAEFRNLLLPGSARVSAVDEDEKWPPRPRGRPRKNPVPPPPPRTFACETAIIEILKSLMASAETVQLPHTPRPRRGPYRKRVPPHGLAGAIISAVARHYGVKVADLISPRRGSFSKASGLPRWTAAHLLRHAGLLVREITDLLGYTETGAYAGLNSLRAARARDPQLDRDISMLLESVDAHSAGLRFYRKCGGQKLQTLASQEAKLAKAF